MSSDGGPEFKAKLTDDFCKRWGIRHRKSSAYFHSSNGRAELAVKSTKRLLMNNVGPSGELDTDKFVRALLMQRNTPDPGCKLSPAEVLLGRPLRDTLPYINKETMAFNNSQIDGQWRDAWRLKEEAMKVRYMKTLENLKEHSRALPPLQEGDHVLIQNQCGNFPKKWDKSGVIVEIKNNDQYVAKVAGSGRLTLRNRRFLKKYDPHHLQGPTWQVDLPSVDKPQSDTIPISQRGNNEETASHPVVMEPVPSTAHDDTVPESPSTMAGSQEIPIRMAPESLPAATNAQQTIDTQQRVTNQREQPIDQEQNTGTANSGLRRSSRPTAQRKVYNASSGKYVEPRSVDDSI
jgi:hypothetical protein